MSTPCINLSSSVFSKSVEMAAQGTWQGIYGRQREGERGSGYWSGLEYSCERPSPNNACDVTTLILPCIAHLAGLVTGLAQMIGPLYGGFAFGAGIPNAVVLLAFFLGLWGAILLVYIPMFFLIPRTMDKMRRREADRLRAIQQAFRGGGGTLGGRQEVSSQAGGGGASGCIVEERLPAI